MVPTPQTPGTPSRRGRRADPGKHRAILDEARRLFTHLGVEAANMDRLAEAAGVSKATIYNHFQSKEQLLQALLEDLQRHLPDPAALVARGPGPLPTRLLAIGQQLCALATSALVLDIRALLDDAAASGSTAPGAFWTCCAAPYRSAFAAMLRETAAGDGLDIPDAELATSQFFALVASEPFLRLASGAPPLGEDALTRHVKAAVDTFLRAFRRTATSLSVTD